MSAAKSKPTPEPEAAADPVGEHGPEEVTYDAGAEIVTPQPVHVDGPLAPPGPPDGFVEIEHPGIAGVAVIPEAALPVHRGRGWRPVGEADKTPEDSSGEPTPTEEES